MLCHAEAVSWIAARWSREGHGTHILRLLRVFVPDATRLKGSPSPVLFILGTSCQVTWMTPSGNVC